MRRVFALFLTLVAPLGATSACHAQYAFQLLVTKNQFVPGQPERAYGVNYPTLTTTVTISTQCSYRCNNFSGRTRDMYMYWVPQVDIYDSRNRYVNTAYTSRSDTALQVPPNGYWKKDDDVFSFPYTLGIDSYTLYSSAYLSEDKTGFSVTDSSAETTFSVALLS